MHDLLTVDQEYVVRAVAYALRNMSIDATNKWSIGELHFLLERIFVSTFLNN